jgi:type II secretory pathway pseudopilin PulG
MRIVLTALAMVAAAAPALAQPLNARERLGQMEAQQAAQNRLNSQQGVAQQNELNSLDARIRTEQALSNTRAAPINPTPVPRTYTRGTPAPVQGTPAAGAAGFADIPDSVLQQSNEAVHDAANNRH